jgi:hypothetical protein
VRRWIRENGHKLAHLFIEKAVSGTVAGDERPELAAALSWIEDRTGGLVSLSQRGNPLRFLNPRNATADVWLCVAGCR